MWTTGNRRFHIYFIFRWRNNEFVLNIVHGYIIWTIIFRCGCQMCVILCHLFHYYLTAHYARIKDTGAFEASARAEFNLLWFHFTCCLSACSVWGTWQRSKLEWFTISMTLWCDCCMTMIAIPWTTPLSRAQCPNCWPIDEYAMTIYLLASVDAIPPNEINSSNAFMCHLRTITCNAINVLCAPR